jgi:uncharacterized repeat protein (TIGR01451 family)
MIDMKMNEESAKRVTWSVVAGTMAFVLAAVLLQVLAKPRVSAQSVDEVMAPNLTVEKTVNTAQASAGDTLTYNVRIENTGEGVTASLTDDLPSTLVYVPDSLELFGPGSASFAGGTVTWSYENIGWSQTAVLTFSAQISPEFGQGQIVNTAEVTGAGEVIESSAQTEVQPAGIDASKSAYPSVTRPGGRIVYTIRIANTGDSSLDTIQVTDELPSEVSYLADSVTATVGSFSEAGGVVTWDVTAAPDGPLPPLTEASLSFSVDVSPSLAENERFTNTAAVVGVGAPLTVGASAKTVSGFYLYLPYFPNRWPPIPYQPQLQAISDPGVGVNDYTVRWSYEYTSVGVISYTLEEAGDASFVGAVEYVVPHSGPLNEKQFTGKPDGVYYYRVTGHNEYGEGQKSIVRSVLIITAYNDDFSNPATGWPNQRGDIIDDRGVDNGDWYRRYLSNGQYQIMIGEASCWTCYWFLQPNALAPFRPPTDKYCVETKAKFEESGWWANMGLIFGANEANTKLYALCLSRGGDPDKLGWFLMMKDDYDFPKRGCSGPTLKIDGSDLEGTSRDGWNRLQVGVDGDKVKIWIGGKYKGQETMAGLRSMTHVGLIGGVYEILTVDTRFDYFKVTLNSDCTP